MRSGKRKIEDSRRAIRKVQPKVSKSITSLIDKWNKSPDKKAFNARFGKK